ncbi:hypothetical protein AHAS_Ahas16G0001000 [Arachis hypogaea]
MSKIYTSKIYTSQCQCQKISYVSKARWTISRIISKAIRTIRAVIRSRWGRTDKDDDSSLLWDWDRGHEADRDTAVNLRPPEERAQSHQLQSSQSQGRKTSVEPANPVGKFPKHRNDKPSMHYSRIK